MKESNDNLNDYMAIIPKLTYDNLDYFQNTTYEIKIEKGKGTIIETESIFDKDVSIPVMCLKLIHNWAMIFCFAVNFAVQNNVQMDNYLFSKKTSNKDLYLKISVGVDTVNIDKRKGFGVFTYNVDEMFEALMETTYAIKKLVMEKSDEYKDLKRIEKYINDNPSVSDVNTPMILFIQKNFDLYSNL
ncbi:MAG: hypothetical protein PHD02_04965 [Bacilli bacterium]|nr:hypothetical protein [Bacilli bacterium]